MRDDTEWVMLTTIGEFIEEGYTDEQIMIELDIERPTLLAFRRKIEEREQV